MRTRVGCVVLPPWCTRAACSAAARHNSDDDGDDDVRKHACNSTSCHATRSEHNDNNDSHDDDSRRRLVLSCSSLCDVAALQRALCVYAAAQLRRAADGHRASAVTLPRDYVPDVQSAYARDDGDDGDAGATRLQAHSFCLVPGALQQQQQQQQTTTTTQGDEEAARWRARLAALPLPSHVVLTDAPNETVLPVFAYTLCTHCAHVSHSHNTSSSSCTCACHDDDSSSSSDDDGGDRDNNDNEDDMYARPLLMIGAGGIGCELLKTLVLCGFRAVHVVDLDTIDATNLNRQLLFTSADVGQAKACVAAAEVRRWYIARCDSNNGDNDNDDGDDRTRRLARLRRRPLDVVAYHANIMDAAFDDAFFARFAVVLSALDNVKARQHVNRMCARARVPLIESGTMGYNGQVQPIVYGRTECYDCHAKAAERVSFAVCTVHARPTTMVHCVHYAKELYETLFCDAQSHNNNNDSNNNNHDDGATSPHGELDDMRAIVHTWQAATSTASSSSQQQQRQHTTTHTTDAVVVCAQQQQDAAATNVWPSRWRLGVQLATALFDDKVRQLLAMKADWPTAPPLPLDVAQLARTFVADNDDHDDDNSDDVDEATCMLPSLARDAVRRYTVVPSVADNVRLFCAAAVMCARRARVHSDNNNNNNNTAACPAGFSKDDDAAVFFVAATANLRAHCFHIALQTIEQLRSVAGGIVPAIATTNAIVAAAVVQQLRVLLLQQQQQQHSQREHVARRRRRQHDDVDSKHKSSSHHHHNDTDSDTPPPHDDAQAQRHDACRHASCMVYVRKVPQTRRRRVPALRDTFLRAYDVDDADRDDHGDVAHMRKKRRTDDADDGDGDNNSTTTMTARSRAAMRVTDHYLVHSAPPHAPNARCAVCQQLPLPRVRVALDTAATTLGDFVRRVVVGALHCDDEGVVVSYGGRIVYDDDDYVALAQRPLADLASLQSSVALHDAAADAHDDANTPTTVPRVTAPSLVFIVDAANRVVEWEVTVTHVACDRRRRRRDDFDDNDDDDEDDAADIVVDGVAQALRDEAACASQRRQQAQAHDEPHADTNDRHRDALAVTPTTTAAAAASAVIDLDDDDDESNGADAHTTTTTTQQPHNNNNNNDGGEANVCVIDDD